MQHTIKFLEFSGMWVLCDVNHVMRGFTLETFPDYSLVEVFSIPAHIDKITGIEELSELKLLATSSLDGKLKFWDSKTFELECEVVPPGLNT